MAIIKVRNPAIDLDAAEIPNLPASKITSGTLDNARISLDAAEIPNLDTAKITTGTLADARLPANALNSNVSIPNQSAFKNIIINGDMSIAQRATSQSSVTTTGYYTCDRFQWIADYGTVTLSQDTTVPSGQGFAKSYKVDVTTAGTVSSGGYVLVRQKIEGQNLQYLKKGTSSAESLTLSFWIQSTKTGTYIAELYDADNNRQISKAYTVSSSNTWEKKTLTFAGDTSGAFGNDNGGSLFLNLYLSAGTDYTSGTLNTSWNSSTNVNRVVGQVNAQDNASNNIYFTGVQLEAGTTASDFEFLPYDVNLERCQRYYEILPVFEGFFINVYSSTAGYGYKSFTKIKRANPSITVNGTTTLYSQGVAYSGTLSSNNVYTHGVNFLFYGSGFSVGNSAHVNNNGGTKALEINSEL